MRALLVNFLWLMIQSGPVAVILGSFQFPRKFSTNPDLIKVKVKCNFFVKGAG